MVAHVTEETRTELVLANVLWRAPEPNDDDGRFRIEEAWVDSDAICIVYRG